MFVQSRKQKGRRRGGGDDEHCAALLLQLRSISTSSWWPQQLTSVSACVSSAFTVNIAQHSYFNLHGHSSGRDILDHQVKLAGDHYTPVNNVQVCVEAVVREDAMRAREAPAGGGGPQRGLRERLVLGGKGTN